MPKRENLLLAFFALSEPIWVGGEKSAVNQKKILVWPKLKADVVALEPICVLSMGFCENFTVMVL